MHAPADYGAVARTLHWLIALILSGSFSVGFYMDDLPVSRA